MLYVSDPGQVLSLVPSELVRDLSEILVRREPQLAEGLPERGRQTLNPSDLNTAIDACAQYDQRVRRGAFGIVIVAICARVGECSQHRQLRVNETACHSARSQAVERLEQHIAWLRWELAPGVTEQWANELRSVETIHEAIESAARRLDELRQLLTWTQTAPADSKTDWVRADLDDEIAGVLYYAGIELTFGPDGTFGRILRDAVYPALGLTVDAEKAVRTCLERNPQWRHDRPRRRKYRRPKRLAATLP